MLEDIIRDHPVLLNRAPTLHRIGIQAFEPVLVEGKAIRIHPLVCAAFNADFDGDQMAVHLPLSYEAQLEARVLMLSSNNVLLPSNGRPVASPSQDMVIGSFYLTKPPLEVANLEAQRPDSDARLNDLYEGAPRYTSYGEVEMALAHRFVKYATPCWYLVPARDDSGDPDAATEARWVRTTVGRVVFNSIIPDSIGFINRTFDKKQLGDLVFRCFKEAGLSATTKFLDDLKDFGFRYATRAASRSASTTWRSRPRRASWSPAPNPRCPASERRTTRGTSRTASATTRSSTRGRTRTTTWRTRMVRHLERVQGRVQLRLHDDDLRRARKPRPDAASWRACAD